jgi:hypothetical protein
MFYAHQSSPRIVLGLQALENYLRRLLGVPSVPSNADLLAFLGHKV